MLVKAWGAKERCGTGGLATDGAGQATKDIQSYTRPAGAVLVARGSFSWLQVNEMEKSFFGGKTFTVMLQQVRSLCSTGVLNHR